jgi:RNA polymerase sigma-70 factor (ECF subfamily)
MNLHHIDDATLATLCVSRPTDRAIANELIRRYGPVVLQSITWTLKRFSIVDTQEVEDQFQEVFACLFEKGAGRLKGFDAAKAGLGTYLSVIARNRALNALRIRGPGTVELSDGIEDDRVVFLAAIEDSEMMARIRTLVAGFTANERLFYHLYFVESMPPEDVARVMAVSVESVYSKKAKLGDKLKRLMKKEIEQG